jgi:hypothetical protein
VEISGIAIPEGISDKARRVITEKLIPLINTDLVKAHLIAFFVPLSLIIEDERADEELYLNVRRKIVSLIEERGHWISDYTCHTHQCLASECDCLEEERRTHHFLCGSQLVFYSGDYSCPLCDIAAMEIELELENPTPPPTISPPVVDKDYLPSGHWRSSVKTP